MELQRSDPAEPGISRRRCGRGFRYLGPDGRPVGPAEVARIKDLVIPPAWQDVWICPDPDGHIQATGTDAAGRRQYLYHPQWRVQRDREKHDRVLDFAEALPRVRKQVTEHLTGRDFTRERVLAAAVRLIDLGFFRAGGEEYAEENGTYGMATVLREHVTCRRGGEVIFEYPAKGAKDRYQAVAEEDVCKVVSGLKRRRDDGPELLAYRTPGGWHDVTAGDINEYLREISGGDFTAKDFRTWHATVLAAVGLAVSTPAATSESARKRAVSRVVQEVADYLGNTPAVARASYIDPRVIELYERNVTIAPALTELGHDADFGELATQGRAETAVLKMLRRHQNDSP
ncbi:DNA topoisomerase IB [Thermomonospora echinospora]|uniref:DNA topoisomerase n=1 Tax=Thermomonospora echinospora TaxID=1992 RepID=A0A1H6D1J1_9ACTN|nr:DNA topoisomerase IB [Thermomonospora echinospora]SEG79087.1 DNA topoisomerase IB [Thermomonospora echinospora]